MLSDTTTWLPPTTTRTVVIDRACPRAIGPESMEMLGIIDELR
jgi:hypothetical protein